MATSRASYRDRAPGTSPRERRRYQRARFSVRRPVSISLDRKATAVILDLSSTGVGVRSLSPIKRGSKCRLQFQLPDSRERVEAEAVAQWGDESCRAGFEFTAMAAPIRALLAEWVERRSYSGSSPFSWTPARPRSHRGTEIVALERELQNLDVEDGLRLIVAHSQSLTEAEGAAIALSSPQGIVCRATLGNAPDLGVTICSDSGLSGECLRTGVVVRCENTELDPRVDREVCRALHLRSAVVVPVIVDSFSVAGMLEVFSSRPHAFSGRHVLLLRQLAELISRVVSSKGERTKTATAKTANPAAETIAVEAEAQIPAGAAVALPDSAPAKTGSLVTCDVCGFENLPIDRDCQNCDVPLPTALDKAHSFTAEPPPLPLEPETVPGLPKVPRHSHSLPAMIAWFLLGIVLAVSAVAGVRWWRTQQTRPAEAAAIELSPLLNTTAEASGKPVRATSSSAGADLPRAQAAVPKPSPMRGADAGMRRAKLQELPASATPVSAPPPATLIPASKLDAPVVAVLSAPEAVPRWVIASSLPVPAKLVQKVEPVYPPLAIVRGIQGKVLLRAIISHKGAVQSVTVLQGNELLAQAAIHAVRQWRYSPAQLDGQPIEADANITISFSLGR